MSGKPSVEGVKELRKFVEQYRQAQQELRDASQDMRRAENRTESATSKAEKSSRAIMNLLESMDVRSSGNAGFEGRFLWFMAEFSRQESEEAALNRNRAAESQPVEVPS